MIGLYYHSLGRAYKVLAVFLDDAVANQYMEHHPNVAVIATIGRTIILVAKSDEGIKLP